MKSQTQAIVLHTKRCTGGLLVFCISKEHGRQNFFLRQNRSSKTSYLQASSMGYLHALNIIELYYRKSKSELLIVENFNSLHNLIQIRSDISKTCIAMFVSELLYIVLKYKQQDDDFYQFVYQSILNLEGLKENISNFHILFIANLITVLGYEDLSNFTFVDQKNGKMRMQAINLLLEKLSLHLDHKIELKSLDVLHQVFKN